MSHYISNKLRDLVEKRAFHICEYCFLHEDDSFFTFPIDHIISLKHEGPTTADNLAFSCPFCNRNKGSDIGSILLPSRQFHPFYNPRLDLWSDHFSLEDGIFQPKSDIGEVTIKILKLNDTDRILERQMLILGDRYPPKDFSKLIKPS